MKKSIAQKNMLILIFSFIPFMFGLGFSVLTSRDKIYLSTAINMAGAQRMRTMLLANYAQQIHYGFAQDEEVTQQKEIIQEELEKYLVFYDTLKNGDLSQAIISNPFPVILTYLTSMKREVDAYVHNTQVLIQDPSNNEAVRFITSSALSLRDEFHQVTEFFQIQNDVMIQRQRIVDVGMLLFAFLVTISGLFLTKKIRVQEDNLIAAMNQADAASKAKSEFLANMSHEIRTPLNGVIGFTELLKNTPLSPVQDQYVTNANVSGHTLLGIINDILDFSKIEAGMLHLEHIKTDMIEILENSIDIVRFAAEKKHLELLLHFDPSMHRYADIDPIRFKQILANLLGNAVKFTEKGEVELRVQYQLKDYDQGTYSISVRDTGIGITPEQQGKLFKAFSQADSSTTRRFGGTGLGLIISDLIAQKLGSKIQIKSAPGEGTTFYFDVSTRVYPGDQRDFQTLYRINRCMVIDDNENNRLILQQLLESWNIETLSLSNGNSALELLKNSKPFDVIICDYNMPDMDGLETIRRIREDLMLSQEKQPIILLHSSAESSELHEKCDALGVRFRLTKPIKSSDLYAYLAQVYESNPKPLQKPLTSHSILNGQHLEPGDVTILIAEDVPMNMLMIKSLIKQFLPGAELIEAQDGLEVLHVYQQTTPDVIFMDVQMPQMDGLEATRKIRELEQTTGRAVTIVALTAGAFKREQDLCLSAGMDEFLSKPIEPEKLKAVLENLVNKKLNSPSD